MYLKKLELKGFKSFADKTTINFEDGITGIVGPNGSGKSNISDAVRWVLGEQSAKTLRGSKMQDIIFAGTSNRKPLGYGEVTLTLDNSDEKMPIDYSEVSVTRRVFRSGESEYYLNKTSCRLKDIKELFMDTGIGIDGYSIIGQGRIDEILSTKAEDRRGLFEEAAGIVKYKTRKINSEKKLEKTRENITRINDILSELNNQLTPLKNQSKKAEEFMKLKDKLKKLEANLFVREIEKNTKKEQDIHEQKKIYIKRLRTSEIKRDNLEKKYKEINEQVEELDKKTEEIQHKKIQIQEKLQELERNIILKNEKNTYLRREIDNLTEAIDEFQKNIESINIENNKYKEIESTLEKKIKMLNKELESCEMTLREIDSNIEKKKRIIEENKNKSIRYLNTISDKKSKINAIESFNKNINRRIKQLHKEIEELQVENDQKENQFNDTLKEANNTKDNLQKLKINKQKKIGERKKKQNKLDKINKDLNNIKGEIQSKTSKYNLLNNMENEYQGFYKGVKNALKISETNKNLGEGIRGVIAQLIKVDKKYEKAIEISLGSSVQNVVTETQQDAKSMINYLKKNKLGRVTFLPLDSIKGRGLYKNQQKVLNIGGVIGVASDLIKCSNDYNNIFKYLLGRVIIVKDLDCGIKVANLCNHSLKSVTLDGDVINPGGSMTGGSHNSRNTNLISRKRVIKELDKEINKKKTKYKELNRLANDYVSNISFLDNELKKMEEKINKLNINYAKLEDKYKKELEEHKKTRNTICKLKKEKLQLDEEKNGSYSDIKKLKDEIYSLKNKNKLIENSIDDMVNKNKEKFSYKKETDSTLTNIKVKIASFEQELKSIKSYILKNNNSRKKLLKDLKYKKIKLNKNQEQIDTIEIQCEQLNEDKNDLEKEVLKYNDTLINIKKQKSDLMMEFKNGQNELKEINNIINKLQKHINTLDIKGTKCKMNLENISNKLWDEYELSYQMALKYKDDTIDISLIREDITKTKRKIRSLGNVNLDAIEEYKSLKERYNFMIEQKTDLNEAETSLKEVINNMEKKMEDEFIKNFYIIKKNFGEIYSKLFGGGKADAYLEDEENILTSGIEIIAQPPGKKLQKITLLSGGEKALTAIALLFAILKLKPTPFCILDEIEAALDDANVYRFSEYLREFSSRTQFIVITHRKGTMESVDSLYGITMEEKGVSKIVSVKLSDKLTEKVS